MLDQELVVELTDVGGIVESADQPRRSSTVKATIRHVGCVGGAAGRPRRPGDRTRSPLADRPDAHRPVLPAARSVDRDGRLVAASRRGKAAREEAGRSASRSVSTASRSCPTPSTREVYEAPGDLHRPSAAHGARTGAVGVIAAWYDLQAELSDMVAGRQVQPERLRRGGGRRRARSSRTRTGNASTRTCRRTRRSNWPASPSRRTRSRHPTPRESCGCSATGG